MMLRSVFNRIQHSSLVHATSIYTFTGVINGSVIFLLLPVLTRHLSPEAYGIVANFRVLVSFVLPLIGFFPPIGRQYFDRDRLDFRAYMANVLLTIFVNALVVGALLFFVSGIVERYAAFPAAWLWAVLLFALGRSLLQTILLLWRVEVKPYRYGILQIAETIVSVAAAILFVVVLGLGWQGAVEADAFAMLLFGAAAVVFIVTSGWFKPRFRWSYIVDIFVFSTPLIFHTWGRTIITMVDRIFITNLVGLGEAGIYAAGCQIGMIIFVITASFNNAWMPYLFEKLKEGNERSKLRIVRFLYLYFIAVFIGSLALGWIAPPFISFFLGRDFSASARFVPWIALGFGFNAMYWMVVSFITYTKKTYIIAIITVAASVLNLAMNYNFIKAFGAIGAAYAAAITFFIMFIATWIVSARVFPMPWGLKIKSIKDAQ
jgi:O-antigen/teichoic acid export membrane protein